MHIKIFSFVVLLLATSTLFAQQEINVSINDSITVEAGPFRGDLQWESSSDQISWSNIPGATHSQLVQKILAAPVYFRARVIEENCAPLYSTVVTVRQLTGNLWSDPATWNGSKPVDGQEVVIPEGIEIILDENTPALGGLLIEGKLTFARKDLALTAKYIMVE